MSRPIYIFTTRLSEPTYYKNEGFPDPIWYEFRKDPKNWVGAAKKESEKGYSWRGSTAVPVLTGGDESACIAVTTKDPVAIQEVVDNLLEVWPEVYVLDGPSYAVYSKLLMCAVESPLTLTRHKNAWEASFIENFHLAKLFDQDPDALESALERSHKYSNYLELLREDAFSEFTLLSPYVPESLMLNFYSKISNKLHLYYQLGDQVCSVNLVDEFSDACDQLASLYMAGCLSCSKNHNCLPELTEQQVSYGFRLTTKQMDKVVRRLSDSNSLQYAPMGAHRTIRESTFRLLNSSYVERSGTPRSTDQILLTKTNKEESTIVSGITAHFEDALRRTTIKAFREKECSRCLLADSCSSVKLNTATAYRFIDVSKACRGAVTREIYRVDTTLLRIAASMHLYVSEDKGGIASAFTSLLYTRFSSIELSTSVKKAMGILTSNSKFFYGAIVLPSCMVDFMEFAMDSKACDTLFHDWGTELNRGKFVGNHTSRIHTGIGGLEKFSNEKSSKWSILLPTHKYSAYNCEEEFTSSDAPWYISITAEEFMLTYGDLASSRVYSSSWMTDISHRILYLVQAFIDITMPRTIVSSGSFGINKSVMPLANVHISLPSNKYLKELSKSTNTIDLLTNYINTYVSYASAVGWPVRVVLNAFPIETDYYEN